MNDSPPATFVEKSPAVFVPCQQPVTVGPAEVEMLKQRAATTPKRRARICAHASSNDLLHEMLIALDTGTYVRPHRHHGKCESMHAIEGRAALLYFTEAGSPLAMKVLGNSSDADCFFCRTNQATYHTVIVLTETFVFHETVQGPFHPGDTEYASWAPAEDDTIAVSTYRETLARLVEQGLQPGCAWRWAAI